MGDLAPDDIARLRNIAQATGITLPAREWTLHNQCDAFARAVGPQWVGAYDNALVSRGEIAASGHTLQGVRTTLPTRGARAVRRRVEPSLVAGYEQTVIPDIQYQLMRTLVERDPVQALRMAASSRQQAEILQSLAPIVARESALVPLGASSADARRLLAANARLAHELHGGTAPDDWELAIATCLMQAFVTYLLTPNTAGGGRFRLAHLGHAYGPTDPALALRAINQLLDGLSLTERARNLYEWIAHGSIGAYLAGNRSSPIALALKAAGFTDGYFMDRIYENCIALLPNSAVRVGDRAPVPLTMPNGALSVEARALQPVMLFQHRDETVGIVSSLGNIKNEQSPILWHTHTGEHAAPVASPQAQAAIRQYIDTRVHDHVGGHCARSEHAGDATLPPFSAFFPGAIYVIPSDVGPTGWLFMLMDLRSPRIERLLRVPPNRPT